MPGLGQIIRGKVGHPGLVPAQQAVAFWPFDEMQERVEGGAPAAVDCSLLRTPQRVACVVDNCRGDKAIRNRTRWWWQTLFAEGCVRRWVGRLLLCVQIRM